MVGRTYRLVDVGYITVSQCRHNISTTSLCRDANVALGRVGVCPMGAQIHWDFLWGRPVCNKKKIPTVRIQGQNCQNCQQ
jgi:hypothetical protein